MQSGYDDGWQDEGCPLPDVPPVDLPDDEPEPIDFIDEAQRAARSRNVMDGQIALAVLHELHTTSTVGLISPRDLVAAEIGPALGIGSRTATDLVDVCVALHTRLPATLRAVCAGDLSWYKAVKLAELTAALSLDLARRVEEMVLAKAGGRTPARHADAVRRAVAHVDPEGVAARRKQAQQDVKLIRRHYGDGMGELFARMASEQLDTVWTAADMWARARKADGDPRTLDQLRVASLVQWAQSFLHHGDPTYCDRWCEPGSHGRPVSTKGDDDDDDGPGDQGPDGDGPDGDPDGDAPAGGGEERDLEPDHEGTRDEAPPPSTPPTRHGRPGALHALWDLSSLLGLTRHCGELSDSGAMIPPDAMRDLVAGGVRIRRMLIDPATGELLDLTPRTWQLRRTKPTELDAPVVLGITLPTDLWHAITNGTADPALLTAIEQAPQAVRDMLGHAWTADELDNRPDVYRPSARLAEFISTRDRHPTNPTAGPTAASAADIEHHQPFDQGGVTTRDGLTTCVRHWHNLKTHGGWTVQRHRRGWKWTSPRGRTYYSEPYDYRLGP